MDTVGWSFSLETQNVYIHTIELKLATSTLEMLQLPRQPGLPVFIYPWKDLVAGRSPRACFVATRHNA